MNPARAGLSRNTGAEPQGDGLYTPPHETVGKTCEELADAANHHELDGCELEAVVTRRRIAS